MQFYWNLQIAQCYFLKLFIFGESVILLDISRLVFNHAIVNVGKPLIFIKLTQQNFEKNWNFGFAI